MEGWRDGEDGSRRSHGAGSVSGCSASRSSSDLKVVISPRACGAPSSLFIIGAARRRESWQWTANIGEPEHIHSLPVKALWHGRLAHATENKAKMASPRTPYGPRLRGGKLGLATARLTTNGDLRIFCHAGADGYGICTMSRHGQWRPEPAPEWTDHGKTKPILWTDCPSEGDHLVMRLRTGGLVQTNPIWCCRDCTVFRVKRGFLDRRGGFWDTETSVLL